MKLLICALCALLLTGCAAPRDGVKMSPEEAVACKAQGCTVWTDAELVDLAREIFLRGVQAGRAGSRGGSI